MECANIYNIIADEPAVVLRHMILLGDFNTISVMRRRGIKFETMFTENEPTNTLKTQTYDNNFLKK